MQKKKSGDEFGGVGSGVQGECEHRKDFFVKMQKKIGGGGGLRGWSGG